MSEYSDPFPNHSLPDNNSGFNGVPQEFSVAESTIRERLFHNQPLGNLRHLFSIQSYNDDRQSITSFPKLGDNRSPEETEQGFGNGTGPILPVLIPRHQSHQRVRVRDPPRYAFVSLEGDHNPILLNREESMERPYLPPASINRTLSYQSFIGLGNVQEKQDDSFQAQLLRMQNPPVDFEKLINFLGRFYKNEEVSAYDLDFSSNEMKILKSFIKRKFKKTDDSR